MQRQIILAILIVLILVPAFSANAQGNAICVFAFQDTNENGVRNDDEGALPGINVNLAIETDIIIATAITTQEDEPYCFENLVPGVYNIYFPDSPNHRATTQSSAAMEIHAGQHIRVEFGAQPEEPIRLQNDPAMPNNPTANTRLTTTTRILLALLGTIIVMIFMIGFGAVVVSVMY